MGRYLFRLPDIGEGVAEAEIVALLVKIGDKVEEDQNVAEVMTDKAVEDTNKAQCAAAARLAEEQAEEAEHAHRVAEQQRGIAGSQEGLHARSACRNYEKTILVWST